MHLGTLALSLLLLPGTLAASDAQSPAGPRARLKVVTTLTFLSQLAAQVGGDAVEVSALCDPRQDPHFVEPRPTLMQKAREADLFVEVGLSLELWADKVVEGSGNPRIQRGQPGRVIASAGLTALELPSDLSREWGDVHPGGNPHMWLDPLNAIDMAANIAAALARLDPERAPQYEAGLARLSADLCARLFGAELVGEVGAAKLARLTRQGRLPAYLEQHGLEAQLGGWLAAAAPLQGRPVVSYHRTFVYFAERFGIALPIQIEEQPGIPPSARHRDAVVALMRSSAVRTILLEMFYDRAAADYLAEATGAHVEVVPIDSGAEVGLDSYAGLIDRLLATLVASESLPVSSR